MLEEASLQAGGWRWQWPGRLGATADRGCPEQGNVREAGLAFGASASDAISWQMDKSFFFTASSKMKLMETIK